MYRISWLAAVIFLIFGFVSYYYDYPENDNNIKFVEPLYKEPNIFREYFTPDENNTYIINIFASWCSSCKKEHQNIINISKNFNIPIYGIAVNDFTNQLKNMLGNNMEPYKKVYLDFPVSKISEISIGRIPRTLIINNGNIIYDHTGAVTSQINKTDIFPILRGVKNNKEN